LLGYEAFRDRVLGVPSTGTVSARSDQCVIVAGLYDADAMAAPPIHDS